jgi:hypothetical protein
MGFGKYVKGDRRLLYLIDLYNQRRIRALDTAKKYQESIDVLREELDARVSSRKRVR